MSLAVLLSLLLSTPAREPLPRPVDVEDTPAHRLALPQPSRT
jgi:hypothetical protein